MNILYINHYAGSIYHGMEFRPYYLAREWVKLGYKVTIISANYSHLRQKNIIINSNKEFLKENIDGITYIWCKTPPYQGNGFKRVLNIFTFLYRLYKLLFFKNKLTKDILCPKVDMVIASSTYPLDVILAKKIAKKHDAKFIYEVHDLWPLTPMELGGMSKYNPFIMLLQYAENYGYRNADLVVSLLPNARDHMIEHGLVATKFINISNGVNVEGWLNNQEELDKSVIIKIQEIKAKFNFLVGYAGSIGEANALEFLVLAAKKVPDVAFVLVGDGVSKNKLEERVILEGIENVFFISSVVKRSIPKLLALFDVLYIGWRKLKIYRFGVSPNKIFDYMLAKKPILHAITFGNNLVIDANCGVSVPAEDVSAIIQAVNYLKSEDKNKLQEWGLNGYNYVIVNCDYRVLAKHFILLGEKLHI